MLLLNSMYICLQIFINMNTEGIILSNHSPRQVASDKWQSVTWRYALDLKPSTEEFEQKIKVKMIIERIIKALLNRKIIYNFELIYNDCLASRMSLLNYVPQVLSCCTCLVLYVLLCFTCLAPYVLSCLSYLVPFVLSYPACCCAQCAQYLTCSRALLASVPTCSRVLRASYICVLLHRLVSHVPSVMFAFMLYERFFLMYLRTHPQCSIP